MKNDRVWKSPEVVRAYLEQVQGSIPMLEQEFDLIARLIRSFGLPVKSFLDLGCGDGILSALVLSEFPGAKGALLDFSDPMLEEARVKLENWTHSLNFVRADYSDDAWPDPLPQQLLPFDLIISGFSIHHQPDEQKGKIYRRIYSLLQDGGLFINLEHVASPTPWIESVWDECTIDFRWKAQLNRGAHLSSSHPKMDF